MRGNPKNPYFNQEGYADPTPYRAIGSTAEDERLKHTAKKYLWSYKNIENDIKTLSDEITALQAQRDSITVKMDGMPRGTGISDKTATLATQTADLLLKRIEMRSAATARRAEIVDFIRQIPNRLQARVLYLHFIQGKPFEWIAVDIDKSYRHTLRVYGDALVICGRKLEKEGK